MLNSFDQLQERSNLHRETDDCTVKCLALMLDTSYEDAWNKCKGWGRECRKGFNLMARFEELKKNGLIIEDREKSAKTVKTFQRLGKKGRYVIQTSSHILYYADGVVHDWSDDRQLRIQRIWQLGEDISPEYIDKDCKELDHDYFTRVALAKKIKKRKAAPITWKCVRIDTGETVQSFKRIPKTHIESLLMGRLQLNKGKDKDVKLNIQQIHQFGGKDAIVFEEPPKGTTWDERMEMIFAL